MKHLFALFLSFRSFSFCAVIAPCSFFSMAVRPTWLVGALVSMRGFNVSFGACRGGSLAEDSEGVVLLGLVSGFDALDLDGTAVVAFEGTANEDLESSERLGAGGVTSRVID